MKKYDTKQPATFLNTDFTGRKSHLIIQTNLRLAAPLFKVRENVKPQTSVHQTTNVTWNAPWLELYEANIETLVSRKAFGKLKHRKIKVDTLYLQKQSTTQKVTKNPTAIVGPIQIPIHKL